MRKYLILTVVMLAVSTSAYARTKGVSTGGALTADGTATLTNKTFDANGTGNSLSNVDIEDLANGTDGELITWDASGVPAAVAVGTAAQVLTSNGADAAPTFQDAGGGGGLTLIATATASASSSIDFINGTGGVVIDGTYEEYLLEIIGLVPATDGTLPFIRTTTDATNFDAGGSDYQWAITGWGGGGTNINDDDTTATGIALVYDTAGTGQIGNAAGESFNGSVTIYDPANASLFTTIGFATSYVAEGAFIVTAVGGGYRASAADVDGFRVIMDSGNITSGEFKLYGVVK